MKKYKRNIVCSLIFALGVCFVSSATEIWVSKTGDDTHAGTRESPLASLHMALRKARELRRLNDPSIVEAFILL